jgi:two-component system nitrate/nitrite response regulator NarL
MSLQGVLLVDSSPIFMHYLQRFIAAQAGDELVVIAAELDAAQGLALAARLGPDVVVWGMGLPAQPHLQLLAQLREALPDAGIIVLGFLEDGYQEAALAAGADRFLLKDGLTTTLVATLRELLRGRAAE